ncbi:hypothetical protein JCM11491_007147 [Sporobolomyces phaffii]
MIQVDTARVKPWLVQHLEPITDAEPATLAEYVLALLQRDETPDELERICIESLGDFLEGHTDKFVKEMLAFVRNPQSAPAAPPPAPRKRALEDASVDQSAAKRNTRPPPQPGQNERLPKGMCRDYHMRGFCARGQACPYQHDAFATAQPPPGAFPQFPFPFGGPQGQFPPPGMRPGMGPFPAAMGGFPPQQQRGGGGPGRGGGPFGFPPQFGGGPQQPFGPGGPPHQHPHPQARQNRNQQHPSQRPHGAFPVDPSQPPPPLPHGDEHAFAFASDSHPHPHPYPHANKRRPPPPSHQAAVHERRPAPRAPTGPPPTPLTVLTHRFATNAARQKDLLARLDAGAADDKDSVMAELRKLNKEADEIVALKRKVEAQQAQDDKDKEAKLNAKELALANGGEPPKGSGEGANGGGSDQGDLKAHLEKLRNEAASLGILPGQPNGSAKPFPKRPYPPHAGGPGAPSNRTAQSFRLDNRSTNLIVESLEPLGDPAAIKRHFETFGTVKRFDVKPHPEQQQEEGDKMEEGEERGGEILVGFETRAIAEKAMSSGPPPSAQLAKLRWAPTTATAAVAAGRPSPAAAAPPAPRPAPPPPTKDDDDDVEDSLADLPIDIQLMGYIDPWGVLDPPGTATHGHDVDDDDDERSWNR